MFRMPSKRTSKRVHEVHISKVEMTSKSPDEYHMKLFSNLVDVEMRCLSPVSVATLMRGKVTITIESMEDD